MTPEEAAAVFIETEAKIGPLEAKLKPLEARKKPAVEVLKQHFRKIGKPWYAGVDYACVLYSALDNELAKCQRRPRSPCGPPWATPPLPMTSAFVLYGAGLLAFVLGIYLAIYLLDDLIIRFGPGPKP
jgi:hypothetical protein